MLANLLQSDVMLLVMQTVLKRAIDLKARSFSESHLQKVSERKHLYLFFFLYRFYLISHFLQILHLIGYAIQEQECGLYPFFMFYERAAKWEILSLMEELINNARVRNHHFIHVVKIILIYFAFHFKIRLKLIAI